MPETYTNLTELFKDIANAIREKTKNPDLITADNFPNIIRKKFTIAPPFPSYIEFISPNSFTLNTYNRIKNWDGILWYSTDKSSWSIWDGITTLSSAVEEEKNVLYLRGSDNTKITGYDSNCRWILAGSNIQCIGNIENILDYATVRQGEHPIMANYCYANMFSNCTGLIQAPDLPSTILSEFCYYGMFQACTNLTQMPDLPATILENYCYSLMFYKCTNLLKVSSLPAKTTTDGCYKGMFADCVNLAQAPELPATIINPYSYQYMFSNCTNLIQAPDILANQIGESGCEYMFYGCSNLINAPRLLAVELAESAYAYMFQDCIKLIEAPHLPAMHFQGTHVYAYMFQGCTSLKKISGLPATELQDYCYEGMFYGCTNLKEIPALPARVLKQFCYNNMFYGCTNIKLSASKDNEYTQPYIIPSFGDGINPDGYVVSSNMLTKTGGTFTDDPIVNTTYYLSNANTIITAPFPYLILKSPNQFYLQVKDNQKYWDGILEYSTDANHWQIWNGEQILSSEIKDDFILYLRGTENTVITGNTLTSSGWDLKDVNNPNTIINIECIGNIENLIDYKIVAIKEHPTMGNYCFAHLFSDIKNLTKAPDLLATTLSKYCCSNMFSGCTNLTQAPNLSATTLEYMCYSSMFKDCINLTESPVLPATILADYCYFQMFYGCTSLNCAPVLSATTLAPSCYSNMFRGCTDLTQAPELPATTLADYCYSDMFYDCADLIQAPVLPATILAQYCYNNMFYQCSNLTQAPELPATKLAKYCYKAMFWGCTSLTRAPVLPATKLMNSCYEDMFVDCTSLIQAPALPASILADNCYKYMFWGCINLTQAPKLNAGWLEYACYFGMFCDCTGLIYPPDLPSKRLAEECYAYMFYGCTSLIRTPSLGATILQKMCYKWMFKDCINLESVYSLPATTLTESCYEGMFWGCTNLLFTLSLSATELASYCYQDMYRDCINITKPPVFPRPTTLGDYCYQRMFKGCKKIRISDIKTKEYTEEYYIFPQESPSLYQINAFTDIFSDTGGTFTGNPYINKAYYYNIMAIPGTYLTFKSPNSFTLKVNNETETWNGQLEYSINKISWNPWNGAIISSKVSENSNVLYLRGKNNNYITKASNIEDKKWVLTGSNIACIGNIENLLDYNDVMLGRHPSMYEYCYYGLFKDCTRLTQAPELPATTLKKGCYAYMFSGCAKLTQAPALSATILASNCYKYMFQDCISLTQIPELPASTLENQCYEGMFRGCKNIRISTVKTEEYTKEYRIPALGNGTAAAYALDNMFQNTGGTFTKTPDINTTYYYSIITLPSQYITFKSPNSFTLKVNDETKSWNNILEYSIDKISWSPWNGTTISSGINENSNVLYLRGEGNYYITGNYNNAEDKKWVLTGSNIKCIGNIENLLDYIDIMLGRHPSMYEYCYYGLFKDCVSLTQAPELSATTLTESCYREMFQGCTNLIQTPALPATTLASNCYQGMFKDCTNLTQTSTLPATILSESCYREMFQGCRSLVNIPTILPSSTLASFCYANMFKECISLIQGPVLPATKLTESCYEGMFYGCINLTQVPALPAIVLASYCYNNMFYNCTNIKLSATKTGEYTQEYRIPIKDIGVTATNAFTNMFVSTGGTFKGTPSINTTYYLSNTNKIIIPPIPYLAFRSPDSFTLKVKDNKKHWDGTLEYSTNLTTWFVWSGTFTLSSAANGIENVLYLRGIKNTEISSDYVTSETNWQFTGNNIKCDGNIENLLDYKTVALGEHPNMGSACFAFLFNRCTNLIQAPELPATTLAGFCYYSMFSYCTNLTKAPELPAIKLTQNCYGHMFRGCTNLTQIPRLPATILADDCYTWMFIGCTKIKLSTIQTEEYTIAYRIPSSGTGITTESALTNMFASTSGTFTGTPDINTIYYLSNTNTTVG